MLAQRLGICLGILVMWGTSAMALSFAHDDWTDVLSHFVDGRGRVDYQGLAADRAALDRYLVAIRTIGPTTHPELFRDRDDQLAYYLNAYNALVFDGVLRRGPEPVSVWKGGLVSGYRFFVATKVTIDGRKTSLKKLEDKVIRDGYRDPRVHAALNCASIGCPRLPQVAFDPARLDSQLDAAMREFVGDPNHVRVDEAAGIVYLSRIFDWFSGDFLQFEKRASTATPSIVSYVNRFRDSDQQIPSRLKIKFLEYDKGINAQ